MAKQLQLRRGTTSQHSTFTGALAEVTVDTTKKVVVVHDNSTQGGMPMAKATDTAYAIATVDDFTSVPAGITTVIVKDKDRGGVFNRITSTTANGGTIFSGTGYSWERQYSGAVNVKWFGADYSGTTNATTIIQNVLNLFTIVDGNNGTYKVSALTTQDNTILKNIGFIPATNNNTIITSGDDCTYDNIIMEHSDYILHGIILGDNCKVTNSKFIGVFGHSIVCSNTNNIVSNNYFEGNAVTPLVLEGSNHTATNNKFKNVGGFNLQTRFVDKAIISNNTFENRNYGYSITATSGQSVFTFTLDTADVSRYTARLFTNAGVLDESQWNPTYNKVGNVITVTGINLIAGYIVELNAFVSLENININSESYNVIIDSNIIDGTGDSGIVLCADYHNGILDPSNVTSSDYPKNITVTNNIVKNCLYAGIAETHAAENVIITGNSVTDASLGTKYTDIYYSAGITFSGLIGIVVANNKIYNTSKRYMQSGIQYGGYPSINASTDKQVKILNNSFIGVFVRKVYLPNGEVSLRKHSIEVSGTRFEYPNQIDLDTVWTHTPADNPSLSYGFLGGSGWTPEATIKSGGSYSARTNPNEFVDIGILNKELLFSNPTNIEISFMAKNDTGSSYISFITTLAGQVLPVTMAITDTNWKKYTLLITTDGLDKNGYCMLRVGANSGYAYFQHFRISGVTYE